MESRGKKQKSTVLKVSFPTIPSFERQPQSVVIYQKPYSHDVMTLNYNAISDFWFENIATGIPVQISIRQEFREYTWNAYVSHISKNVVGRLDAEMYVHVVGATYPLKEQATRTFTEMTIPGAVERIAREHGLIAVVDSHPVVFPQLTLAGHSYWEWMAEQAKRIGYALWAENTTIHFRKLDSMVNREATSSPLLYFENKFAPPYSQYRSRTLNKFTPLKGDNIETFGGTKRRIKMSAGFDPVNSAATSAQFSPKDAGQGLRQNLSDVLFSEYRSDQVVQSDNTANQISQGAASMARFSLPAKINCLGDPRIHPFAPVRIQGTGTETDGLWVFNEATHTIRSNGMYEIDGTVLTDGTGSNYVTSLRPDIDWEDGTINFQEAIKNSGVSGTKWGSELVYQQIAYSPKEGGYLQSPARWKAVAQ